MKYYIYVWIALMGIVCVASEYPKNVEYLQHGRLGWKTEKCGNIIIRTFYFGNTFMQQIIRDNNTGQVLKTIPPHLKDILNKKYLVQQSDE